MPNHPQSSLCLLCERPAQKRHLCGRHYVQNWRQGKLDAFKKVTTEDAFEGRIQKTDSCWFWTGATHSSGYGIVVLQGRKQVRAHRFSYEHFNREKIPPGKVVMHTCDTPRCVNPAHLVIGTNKQNSDDKVRKGRHTFGEHHWWAKLSEADILAIRESAESQQALATRYGVSQPNISAIKTGRSWKHS